MQSYFYRRFWVTVTIALSIVVILCGFPAFQKKFGFPESLLWTFTATLGVWATYLIRAYLFSDHSQKNKTKER